AELRITGGTSALRHLREFFGDRAKAVTITTDRMQQYVRGRQQEGAASATINIELALLGKAFTLAVRAKRLRTKPYVPKLAADSTARTSSIARGSASATSARCGIGLVGRSG